jgi:hypothetical protein
MNREQVREAVLQYLAPAVMAFHRGEQDVFTLYKNKILHAITMFFDKPTVTRDALYDAIDTGWNTSAPTRGEVFNTVVTYLKTQGVEVIDEP